MRMVISRKLKAEAVRSVRDRGVTVARAARDLGSHKDVVRNSFWSLTAGAVHAFPGRGQMKPEQSEVRLRGGAPRGKTGSSPA